VDPSFHSSASAPIECAARIRETSIDAREPFFLIFIRSPDAFRHFDQLAQSSINACYAAAYLPAF